MYPPIPPLSHLNSGSDKMFLFQLSEMFTPLIFQSLKSLLELQYNHTGPAPQCIG